MYNIRCKSDYENLIRKLQQEALEVGGTYEVVGETVRIKSSTKDIKEMFDIDDDFERQFIEAISKFEDKNIGPYITSKYFNLIPGVKKAVKILFTDCYESRRCVITFPSEHCFQSIQFLIRENTVNVVCYMRSCNVIKNLPHDIWICSKLADIFAGCITRMTGEKLYKFYDIKMMFGSLHVFKEEIPDVL